MVGVKTIELLPPSSGGQRRNRKKNFFNNQLNQCSSWSSSYNYVTITMNSNSMLLCCCRPIKSMIYLLFTSNRSINSPLHHWLSQMTKQKYIHIYLINLMWLIYFCVILIKLISYSIWSSLNCVTAPMINDLLCKILTKLVSLLSSFSHLTFLLSLLFTHMWLAWSMMTYSCYEYMIHYNIRPRVYLSDYDAIKCKQRFVLS